MKKKLLSRSGETLVESLVAILVAVLMFLFLTTAVVTAAKVNKKHAENRTFFLMTAYIFHQNGVVC